MSGISTVVCPGCGKEIDCEYDFHPFYAATREQPEEGGVEWNCEKKCIDCSSNLDSVLDGAAEKIIRDQDNDSDL